MEREGKDVCKIQRNKFRQKQTTVQKENYKPFSITLNEQAPSAPIVIGIEKSNANGLVLDSNMYHLGDNNYSELSANAKLWEDLEK